MNVRQLKQAWGWMDKDGDGTIQLSEFDQWLFGDKTKDTTFGDTTGARVDAKMFDQFVEGLGIADLVQEASEAGKLASDAAQVAAKAAEEAEGIEEREAVWREEKRVEADRAQRGRERDEQRRRKQEEKEKAAAALGGGGAGAGAVSKLFGSGATGLGTSSALNQRASRAHAEASRKAEYELRLKALAEKEIPEWMRIAPPQPMRLVRREAVRDTIRPKPHKRETEQAKPDRGDGTPIPRPPFPPPDAPRICMGHPGGVY
eukprot:COSAG05_NODE_1136_length_5755_cov_4.734441_2_plen_260_part_00